MPLSPATRCGPPEEGSDVAQRTRNQHAACCRCGPVSAGPPAVPADREPATDGCSGAGTKSATRVVLADGRVALLRELCAADQPGVLLMHQQLDQRDQYFRFFGPLPPQAERLVAAMTAPSNARHGAVGVFLDEVVLGVANYELLADPTVAEVALAVSGVSQAHGVGTLVLEHLASLARRHGVRRFVAEVLSENPRMLRMFRASGLSCRMTYAGSVMQVDIVLDETEKYLQAMGERERAADTVNLRSLLAPRSLAVLGLGPDHGSVGHTVLANVVAGGYVGELYAVTAYAGALPGAMSVPIVASLPIGCELAVLCGPADGVPDLARHCGQRGVRALAVMSNGFFHDGQPLEELLAAVRHYGMRMVGPNSLGVSNSDPDVQLDATIAATPAMAGSIGIITQTGRIGIALREQLGALGLGASTMVSAGDKYDVSGNDLLGWWLGDSATTAVVLCLESFGNPRKFARLCQALGRTKPVVALRTGTDNPMITGSAPRSALARDALYRQAGVVVVDTVTELLGTLAALSWQPLPPGNRVAILTNAGAAGLPDPHVRDRAGVRLAELHSTTQTRLRELLPGPLSVANPVETTAPVGGDRFARCVAVLLDDPGVDSVIAATVGAAAGDPITAVTSGAPTTKPVLAVRLGQPTAVAPLYLDVGLRTVSYADPGEAVTVLGRLVAYASWRSRAATPNRQPPGVDVPRALGVIREYFRVEPAGGWLDTATVFDLLGCFGIPGATLPRPMPSPGPELAITVHCDGVFGPLVGFGLGGADANPVADRVIRFTPLTETDAEDLLHGLGCSNEVFGPRVEPKCNTSAVRDVLMRVSLLAQLLPEIAELEINSLLPTSEGCQLVDARARVVPPAAAVDWFLPSLSG